jgi:hypothetical protein
MKETDVRLAMADPILKGSSPNRPGKSSRGREQKRLEILQLEPNRDYYKYPRNRVLLSGTFVIYHRFSFCGQSERKNWFDLPLHNFILPLPRCCY